MYTVAGDHAGISGTKLSILNSLISLYEYLVRWIANTVGLTQSC